MDALEEGPPQTLEGFLLLVDEMSLMPHSAQRILDLTQSDTASVRELQDAVESDGVLAGRVLKMANSPLVGARSPVGSIARAVGMLGFRGTRDVALALALSGMSPHQSDWGDRLWEHAFFTGAICRMLGQSMKRSSPEDLFVAGLLHDLGLQLLLAVDPEATDKLLTLMDPHGPRFALAERVHRAFDHSQLGAACLRRWGLPAQAADLVALHHAPEPPAGDPRPWATLQVADHLADALTDTEDASDLQALCEGLPALEHLHMSRGALCRVLDMLVEYRDELVAP